MNNGEFNLGLDVAHANLIGATDPTTQALARKALLQASILDGTGIDPQFGRTKPLSFGIFRVFKTTALIDWVSPTSQLALQQGQTYLDFHMPKSDGLTNSAANDGYTQIAIYMATQPDITDIVGVTYRIMAISAQRNQGFNTEQLQLPSEVMDYASAYWQNMMPDVKAKQFTSAHVVWHSRDSFIERFGA